MGASIAKQEVPEDPSGKKEEVVIKFTGMNGMPAAMRMAKTDSPYLKKKKFMILSDFLWRRGIMKNEQDIQVIDVHMSDRYNGWLFSVFKTYRSFFSGIPDDRISNVLFNIHTKFTPSESETASFRLDLQTNLKDFLENPNLKVMFGFVISNDGDEHGNEHGDEDNEAYFDDHGDAIGY